MSYLVLARKFRPQNFTDVVGQSAVVRTLQNALSRQRVAHALIFSGVRGVGKTTLARIMAKALNCEHGPTPNPCNQCRSCTEITAGTSIDLHEVDGASNRGIQEIRELKDKIRFMPSTSRYKIIIIDEVHMLTTEAFNALLKTLEEPPAHVFFMFATTELHRLPVTILSRCQRYELKRVSHRELFHHFNKLAEKEEITIEPAALNVIVREAGGSVRDGLSLLDQIFSYCGDKVTYDEVVDVLGLVGHQVIAEIGTLLLQGDLSGVMSRLAQVFDFGVDPKRFINDLLDWFRSLTICKICQHPENLLDLPEEELALLLATAANYSPETLSAIFNILLDQLEKASFSTRPRFLLETAFLKAVQVRDIVPVSDILGKLDRLLAGLPLEESSPKTIPRESLSASTPATPKVTAPAEAPAEAPTAPAGEAITRQELPSHEPPQPTMATPKKLVQAVPTEPTAPADPGPEVVNQAPKKDIRQHWQEFSSYVKERKPWMAAALQRAAGVRLHEDVLTITYTDGADCRLLKTPENLKPLTEFAMDFFQETFRIHFKAPDSDNGTDSDPENGPQQERRDLANEPLVRSALEIFNGRIGGVRTGPRFRKNITSSPEDELDDLDEQDPVSTSSQS